MNNEPTFNDLKAEVDTEDEPVVKPISDKVDEVIDRIDSMKSDVSERIDKFMEKLSETTASNVAREKEHMNNNTIETSGSVTGNQNIIQNAYIYGGSAIDIKEITNKAIPNENNEIMEYDLTKADEFATFGEKFQAGEHFAFAVMLCVFDYVKLNNLQNLKMKLMEELPKVVDEEGKEVSVYKNPYFPINSVLKSIKGKVFATTEGEKCIGLGNSRSLALKNLWEQFPSMRDCISQWLLNVSDVFEYRTSFDIAQLTTAFINIMKLDFYAGTRHIFPRLYLNPNKTLLLGDISLALYNDETYQERILSIITGWASSSNSWLWRPAFYVFSYIKKGNRDSKFHTEIRKMLEYRLESFAVVDLQYISRFLIFSEHTRTFVAQILGRLAEKHKKYDDKRSLAAIYLLFVRNGYFAITQEYTTCPFVACDTKDQLLDIQPLITISLQKYDTRRTLFSILEAYLIEISIYNVTNKVINHIKAYFILMAQNNPRHVNDIRMMLHTCHCTIAKELLELIK